MTLFGEKLKKLVDSNNINVYRLSQRAGIERTIVHKIMSGNRIPDAEYIRKLIAALPVSPFEKDELFAAYNISKDGELLYYQRVQVQQLIERMSAVQEFSPGDPVILRDYMKRKSLTEVEVVNGTLSVNNLVNDMINRELRASSPCVRFVMPQDYGFFYDTLFLRYRKTQELKIECLFEFYKNIDIVREKRNANLDVISALAPFIMHGGSFSAYYMYSTHPAGSTSVLPMPYFIVTSHSTATFTADLQTAIAYNAPDVTACYSSIFENMKLKAQPLIGQVASMDDTIAFYSANLGSGAGIAGFGSHPCITAYYDKKTLEAHISKDIPNREQLIEASLLVCKGMQELSRSSPTAPSFFTVKGLDLFAEKGVIQTIVERFFSPYTPEERVEIIQKMIADTESDNIVFRIIDTSKIKIPECFYTDVFGSSHINIVIGGADDNINTVNIFEDSVVEAFYDFLINAADTDLVYSKEDTLKTLHHALEKAKKL